MINAILAVFVALTLLVTAPTMAQQLSPKEIVWKICETQHANSTSGDKAPARRSKLWKLVDQHFDHEGYVKFVAGPTWKNSTPQKQQAFSAAVYKTLDDIVAVVADVFISECTVGEAKMADGMARIPTRFVEKGDEKPQAHQITFQLELKNGSWKVSDLLINGSFSARAALAEKHRKTYVALLQ